MRKLRRFIIIAAAAAAAVAAIFVYSAVQNRPVKPLEPLLVDTAGFDLTSSPVTLIAQGGFACQAPENTIAAFEIAGGRAYPMAQLDVRLTRDHVWAVFGSRTLSRMTSGFGLLGRQTYARLLDETVDNGANAERYPDQKIPVLEDVLEVCFKYNIRPLIHLESGASPHDAGRIAQRLNEMQIAPMCAVCSDKAETLLHIGKLSEGIRLWYMPGKLDSEALAAIDKNPGFIIYLDAGQALKAQDAVKTLLASKRDVACFGVDDMETFKQLYALGIRTMATQRICYK